MANTIIAKFQAEGLGQFTSEVNNASTQMEMFDKAQKIVNQTTGNLTKKQQELKTEISKVSNEMQKMTDVEKLTSTAHSDSQNKLKKLVTEYQNETKELQKKSTELKKITLDSNNYAKVLDQVAKGEISAREASNTLRQEFIKLGLQQKQGTKQYEELRDVAGALGDAVGDASDEIKQAGSDTRGLDKAIRVATTLTAGFGLVEGATALFGKENENLQKTLVKVNGLMVVMNSLQEIQEELKKKDSVFTALQTKAQQLYNVAVGQSTGALKLLRVAMLGLGIGVVIAGLYLLVTNWQKIKDAVTGTTDAMRENTRISKLNADTRREAADSIKGEVANIYELVAVAKNENLTRADRQHAIDELQKKYPDYLKNISLETIGTVATSKAIQAQIELLTQREQIKKLADKRAELSNKLLDNEAIDQQFSAYEKAKIFLAKLLSGKNEDGSRDDAGNPDLQNVLTTARSRVKTEIQKQIDDIDAQFSQILGKIGKSNISVFSGEVVGGAAGENLAKDVKKGAEQQAKGDPIVLEFELKLNDIESETKQRLEDAIANFKNSFSEALANNDLENPLLKAEVEQIRILEKELERLRSLYNSYFEESIGKDFERELKAKIDDAKAKFKDAFNIALENGENIKDNPVLKAQIEQIKALEKELERLTSIYNSYFEESKQVETASNVPIIELSLERTRLFKSEYQQRLEDVKNFKEQGLISEKEYNDEVARLQQQRLATIEANAQKAQTIYGEIFNVVSQGTQLAGQIIAQNAQKEIAVLDEKKNRGLISEKQYNKEIAKIKNEEAQKQRKVDIAMAFAMIPQAALSAFTSTPGGLVVKSIAAALASAFGLAQVALIAKAPLPKFRHGGLVVGNKHEQGGVHAELEGNEFVLKREAVSKYGTKALDKINNGLLNPNVFNMPLLPVNMIYGNHTRNLDRSSEQIKNLQYKLSEKLEYIYQGIENGNQDRYMLAKKSNKILEQLKDNNKYGRI